MTLATLKTRARAICALHGHTLVRFSTVWEGQSAFSACVWCGMEVEVDTHPLAGEVEISGEAVDLPCPYVPWSPPPSKMEEYCDSCGEPLEEGQIGLCDSCQGGIC